MNRLLTLAGAIAATCVATPSFAYTLSLWEFGSDPRGEFDFAKKCDDAGFIFWCDSQPNGNAKGLMDNQLWNWGRKSGITGQCIQLVHCIHQ